MLRNGIGRIRFKSREVVKHCCALVQLRAVLGTWRLVRMPWLFYQGLVRVFTVLDFGRFILGAGNKTQRIPVSATVRNRKGLLLAIKQGFVRQKLVTYARPESLVLFFGATANNEREFYFFSGEVKPLGIDYSRAVNLSFADTRQYVERQEEVTCKLLLSYLAGMFTRKLECNSVVADVLLAYCKYFYRFFCFFLQEPKQLPRLAVVANDHSASAVAFSMVMKLFGVPRVYLQHAEVSPRFPALDFEYAILRNHHSARIYRGIKRPRGKVYIVSRQRAQSDFEKIFRLDVGRVAIVIYLTALFIPAQLLAVVEALRRNPNVSNVQVKFHPRTSPELQAAVASVTLAEQTPSFDHIAIVANSSIAIELLSAGIKVFQLFALDDIGADYYGFTARGLTPEISFSDLEQSFWQCPFYTESWKATMADYDPTLAPSVDDLQPLIRDLVAYLVAVE